MRLEGLKRDKFPIGQNPIDDRLRVMGKFIMRDFETLADPDGIIRMTVVVILKGAFVFASDLIRQFRDVNHEAPCNLECRVEFLIARSRPSEKEQTEVALDFAVLNRGAIEGKHVLVVDDIFDSGYTLEKVLPAMAACGPKTLKVAVLLDKPSRRHSGCTITADYTGFEIPNYWVVGYGLDEGQLYRTLPYIDIYDREKGGPRSLRQ